jgi:hypothetical protein
LQRTVPYLTLQLQTEEDVDVITTILKGLFDIILFHGHRVFSTDDAQTSSMRLNELLQLISKALNHADGEVRTIAVEGFAKLLFTDALADQAQVLSKLIVLYFNPATEEDYVLRQCLHVFFSVYTLNAPHQDVLEQCFIPTLHCFVDAPNGSTLNDVKVVDVGRMMLNLLDRTPEFGSPHHDRLAMALLNEIRLSEGMFVLDSPAAACGPSLWSSLTADLRCLLACCVVA